MHVLGISGSLRQDSYNYQLLQIAASKLPQQATFEIYSGLQDIPAYNQDLEHPQPDAVQALRQAIAVSDAVIFATPEYNHSIPGALKNALDWVSRPMAQHQLYGKPVLVLGASASMFGAVWAQDQLRKLLGQAMGANVVEGELPIGFAEQAFEQGQLTDSSQDQQLQQLIDSLLEKIPSDDTASVEVAI